MMCWGQEMFPLEVTPDYLTWLSISWEETDRKLNNPPDLLKPGWLWSDPFPFFFFSSRSLGFS